MSNAQRPAKELSRRKFLGSAVAGTAAAAAGAAAAKTASAQVYKRILPQSVLGANEIIRTGHIGIGGQGRVDMNAILEREAKDIKPIALCDIYKRNLDRAAQRVSAEHADFTTHHDFREVIENKDVDAVVIATPDHWHCLVTMYAADAKKAIYCEKPASTTVAECQAMKKAVRENGVVFQAGNMQRSGAHFQEAVALIRSGYIGTVAKVDTWIHDSDPIDGFGPDDTDQAKHEANGLDWNFQQGWVEHQPFNTHRWIYNWRWFLDYSGGKITDWGAHLIDIALWGMGEEKKPKSVGGMGRKFVVTDSRTTADTLDMSWEFDGYILNFQNRVWNQFVPKTFADHGIAFHGTLGTMVVSRAGYEVFSVGNNKGCEPKKAEGVPSELLIAAHVDDFAKAVRSGKDPISSIDVIVNTSNVCHIGTAAYVADAHLKWDAAAERFAGDDEATKKANDFIHRPYLNGWSLEKPYWRG